MTGKSILARAKELFLYVKPESDPYHLAGRALILAVILIWGARFLFTAMESNYPGISFMHLVNLPFHEAGHIFLRPFGRYILMLRDFSSLIIPWPISLSIWVGC